ncbi:MAG: NUDIX hydrolase [Actinomycetota bacterium]
MEPIPWFVEPVRAALAAGTRSEPLDSAGARPAAVLLMLFEQGGEPALVLTKRSDTVRHHKGEISFPGGMQDPVDADLLATAIRETVEELGVDAADVDVIGELNELHTYVTGFVIKPYVAYVRAREIYEHSVDEIAEVLRVPLRRLTEVGHEAEWERQGFRFTTNVFEVDGHVIWGATGRILRDFLDVVAPALDLEWSPGSVGTGDVVPIEGGDDRWTTPSRS